MNWDAIGAIGEIIGAFAVVVSIIYLAFQINSNTRTMRANAGFEATHSWAKSNEVFSQCSDEQLRIMIRALSTNETWDDFSDIERARISLMFRALFQKLEGQYYLFKYNTLDEGIWKGRAMFAAGLLQKPFFQSWWIIEKDQRVYSDDFIRVIESTKQTAVTLDVLGGEMDDG